jgi:signal transduction histidine kinase/CheY-like chemotaxis protein/ligand-binding sensor domain-containing protein
MNLTALFRHLLALLLCLPALVAVGQRPLSFDHVQTHGYTVFSVCRAQDGMVWLGTSNGLTTLAEITGSRPFGYVRHARLDQIIANISQDPRGRLWLMTQTNKYMVYDPRTNQLISDMESYLRRLGIDVTYDFRLQVDGGGRLWVHKQNRLYLHDLRTGRTRLFVLPPATGPIIGMGVGDDEALVVTAQAVYRVDSRHGSARRFAFTPRTMPNEYLYVVRNGRGSLWLAASDLLYRYDEASCRWHPYAGVKSDIRRLQLMPDGKVYVATTNHGLYLFDAAGKLDKHLMQSDADPHGLTNNHINNLYYDPRDRALWVMYHKHDFSVYTADRQDLRKRGIVLPGKGYDTFDFISFSKGTPGTFWVGTEDNGAFQLADDGSERLLDHRYDGDAVTALFTDRSGRLWAGLYRNGLVCSDGRRFFDGKSPYAIVEGDDGVLYLALNGDGIWRMDPHTGDARRLPTENPWIMSLAYRRGMLYAASPKYLYIIDTRTGHTRLLPGTIFRDSNFDTGNKMLIIDRRGWLWLVNYKNSGNVDVYDTRSHRTFKVTGLPNYAVNAIAEDPAGNIWYATDRGLVRVRVTDSVNPRFSYFCFNVNDDSHSTFYNLRALQCLDNGMLLAGTTAGYEMINTRTIDKTRAPEGADNPLVLTSLVVNDNVISPAMPYDGRYLVKSDLPYVRQVSLRYNENNLTMEYRPKGKVSDVNNTFAYRLADGNGSWMPMNGWGVTLSNLSPGTHRLLLMKSNAGTGEQRVYTALTIRVRAPWWRTGWAYTGYGAVAILLAAGLWVFVSQRQVFRLKMQQIAMEQEQERRMNEMKLRFFTNISHDLRTPLSLIISPIEDLLASGVQGSTRDLLTLVNRNAQQLYHLVNQLLDFRKLDQGGTHLQLATGNLSACVTAACEAFAYAAKDGGLTLALHTPQAPVTMCFDSDKIGKAVTNVLANAMKFTPRGGRVDVRVETHGGQAVVSVADTGVGIPDADKERVFERYRQLSHTAARVPGSGIGLHIVKTLVELHQGMVRVEDNVPQGTVVRMVLPMAQGDGALPPTADAGRMGETEPVDVVDQHDKTVLVVEDNADLIDYLHAVLTREYRVLMATDGNMALDVLRHDRVDVIVSDIMMEGMDGLTLCKTVKSDVETSHIPLLLLTAKAMAEDELRGLQLGADDYITKPVNMGVLRLRIRRILERTAQARERFGKAVEVSPSDITVSSVDERLIADAIAVVERHIGDADFSVEMLGAELGMHRTNLYKKLTFITGKTPLQFIRLLRLKRARQLLEQRQGYVADVAYAVGFNSPKKFARYFHEEFGIYPSELMRKADTALTGGDSAGHTS